jgi:hypothetical protein
MIKKKYIYHKYKDTTKLFNIYFSKSSLAKKKNIINLCIKKNYKTLIISNIKK